MDFGELFSKSWNEYKANFKSFLDFMLVFRGIPLLIFTIVTLVWFPMTAEFYENIAASLLEGSPIAWNYIFAIATMGLISILLSVFVSGAIISLSLKKSKFTFKELSNEGSAVFFKYLAFSIIFLIFIIPLYLLLIIPGIIFSIYWIFGVYILFDKSNKIGITKSLKESRYMVQGKWWRVFGYTILITLVFIGIGILFGLISAPLEIIKALGTINGGQIPPGLLIAAAILSTITSFATEVIAYPLSILFFKNFYLDLKKNKRK